MKTKLVEALDKVETIICHANCADGIASAIILHQVFPNAAVKFIQYSTKEHQELEATPGMIFCDFSPHRERVDEFVKAGAIVLDHHRTQKEVVEKFGELGFYADEWDEPGVSGAVLAYRHIWSKRYIHAHVIGRFAELAGVRDTWQKQSSLWDEAQVQSAMLTFFPVEDLLEDKQFFATLEKRMKVGEVVLAKKKETTERVTRDAYFASTKEGITYAIVPTLETSDVAEAIDSSRADFLIGFAYRTELGTAPKLILSMRSRSNYDVSKLCQAYGGGGHTKAAGCSVTVVPYDLHPYGQIQKLVQSYEDGEAPF